MKQIFDHIFGRKHFSSMNQRVIAKRMDDTNLHRMKEDVAEIHRWLTGCS